AACVTSFRKTSTTAPTSRPRPKRPGTCSDRQFLPGTRAVSPENQGFSCGRRFATRAVMSIASFFDHLFHPSAQTQGASQTPGASTKLSDGKSGDLDFSFDDLIDIVNPLQHLPVVGTLYRAITHDTIKTPEKIAGDTLYG